MFFYMSKSCAIDKRVICNMPLMVEMGGLTSDALFQGEVNV